VTVISIVWWNLLNQSTGFLPKAFAAVGIDSPAWLTSQPWAWVSLVMATVWWSIGFNVLVFLAGMQNVRADLLEAAILDGTNAWQRFRHVVFPALRPVFVLVVTLQIIAGFNMVGQAQLLTEGGPPPSTTTTVMLLIYQVGFQGAFKVSPAAAMSIVVGIAMVVVSLINYRLTGRENSR
jgi:multiple sugar transport system permease protein